MTVPVLFFLSGATALIYEVLWSKQLGLLLGSTIQAQTIVLAAFMGGLALGNRIFGRWADGLAHPLRAYGLVEVAIGLYAFFFDRAYTLADAAFGAWGRGMLGSPTLLLLLKAALGGALILGPTILMGGTLPLLAAWLRRRTHHSRQWSARFYAINSLGAVLGAWAGGFWLIRELGVLASTQLAALLNAGIGLTALLVARQDSGADAPPPPPPQASAETEAAAMPRPALSPEPAPPPALRGACWLVAFTGAVSMGLEVLASRSLALVFGPSLHAFAIVLIAFILGIGFGSIVISLPRWNQALALATARWLMIGAATLIVLYVLCIQEWVLLYSQLRHGLAANAMGYRLHQLLVAAIAIAILGLPAGLLGSVLPLTLRLAPHASHGLAHDVGRLLTWNTLGAVGGVLLAGFLLMPLCGLRGAFLTLAILLCVAVLAASARPFSRLHAAAAGVGVVALLLTAVGGEGWRQALGSGIFRARNAPLTRERLEQRRRDIDYLFYEDAADATVSVERWMQSDRSEERVLRINGKPDASTQGDLSTQYLLAHLPLLAHPRAQEVFVLGFGSGITAGAVLRHPVQRLTVAENCQPVLRAAPLFARWNRDVLRQPRTRLFAEDARTVLRLDPTRYDVIISEPSNPWVAGIGGVFSREFYQLAASRLTEGGVMAQWFHIYEMHDGIVDLVLRTFASVFPYLEVWESADTDIILLGSRRPWPATPEHFALSFAHTEVRDDLAAIDLPGPEALLARQIASQETAFAITGEGPLQTDPFPVLEYEAPRAFYIGASAKRLFHFDERTHQALLAPAAKAQAAAQLSRAQLQTTFRQYVTGNPALRRLLQPPNPASPEPAEAPPVLFHALRLPPASPPPPPAQPGTPDHLASLQLLLHQSEQSRAAAVQELRRLIAVATETQSPNGKPPTYAGPAGLLLARALLAQGDPTAAAAALGAARPLLPDPDEADYLSRIAARAGAAPTTPPRPP